MFQNVNVFQSSDDTLIATGATAKISDGAETGLVWGGSFTVAPKTGSVYRLSSDGLLDWTGWFTGGHGTQSSPYSFAETDGHRRRKVAHHKAS